MRGPKTSKYRLTEEQRKQLEEQLEIIILGEVSQKEQDKDKLKSL